MSQVAQLHRPRDLERLTGARDLIGMSVVVVLAGLLLIGGALLARPLLSGDSAERVSGGLAMDGGVLLVRGVTAELHSMNPGMPSGMMSDPVPEGFRRVAVNISLLGRAAEGLAYDAADFRATVPGAAPVPPQREAMGRGVIPQGAQVNGILVFEVPEEVTRFRLGLVHATESAVVDLSGIADPRPTGSDPAHTGEEPPRPGADEEHAH